MTTYLTTRSGLVHTSDCAYLLPNTEAWPWDRRLDGPGVARACGKCLPEGLPEGER